MHLQFTIALLVIFGPHTEGEGCFSLQPLLRSHLHCARVSRSCLPAFILCSQSRRDHQPIRIFWLQIFQSFLFFPKERLLGEIVAKKKPLGMTWCDVQLPSLLTASTLRKADIKCQLFSIKIDSGTQRKNSCATPAVDPAHHQHATRSLHLHRILSHPGIVD